MHQMFKILLWPIYAAQEAIQLFEAMRISADELLIALENEEV